MHITHTTYQLKLLCILTRYTYDLFLLLYIYTYKVHPCEIHVRKVVFTFTDKIVHITYYTYQLSLLCLHILYTYYLKLLTVQVLVILIRYTS